MARAEYVHAGLTEWLVNDARGLEQGWTVQQAHASDTLNLALSISGPLRAEAHDGGLRLRDKDQAVRLRYGSPRAWDASGRDLPASLGLAADGQLTLTVVAQDALTAATTAARPTHSI